jgi:hypothetical protein
MTVFSESGVESAARGWQLAPGPEFTAGMPAAARREWPCDGRLRRSSVPGAPIVLRPVVARASRPG